MDTATFILALIVSIPLILGFTFLISGFISSKFSEDEKKPNPIVFIIIFVIVLIALFTYGSGHESAHMFKP